MFIDFYPNKDDQSENLGTIPDPLRPKMREFITKKFETHPRKLFDAYFGCMTFGNATAGINEAEHRVMKKHCQGPRPNHGISESARKINKLSESKEKTKSQKVAFDVTASYAKTDDQEHNAQDLTDYCSVKILEQYKSSNKYDSYRPNEDEVYDKRDYDKYNTSPEMDIAFAKRTCQVKLDEYNNDLAMKKQTSRDKKKMRVKRVKRDKLLGDGAGAIPEYKDVFSKAMKYLIPRYEMTCTLCIVTLSNGGMVLKLDCPTFKKHGYTCRHIYKLLSRDPILVNVQRLGGIIDTVIIMVDTQSSHSTT